MTLAEGTTIDGRIIVQTLIGQGGTADVFGAYDHSLKLHRVLKVGVRPTPSAARHRLEIEERFLQECRHESIPGCYGLLEHDGHAILVLNYCPGLSLEQFAPDLAGLGILGAFQRLLDLISIVHSAGYVYRDLTPSNVIVPPDPSEPWQLIDFNAVCRPGLPAESLGTPDFAAPETLAGSQVSLATDVFSCGCLIRHMAALAGTEIPPLLDLLVEACTEPAPENRPSVAELRERLQDLRVLMVAAGLDGCPHCFSASSLIDRRCADCGLTIEGSAELVARAGQRSMEFAESRRSKLSLAWIRDIIGGRGLSDSQRLELARWYRDRDRRSDALQLLSDSDEVTAKPMELRLIYEEHGHQAALDVIERDRSYLIETPGWVKNAAQILARHGQAPQARTLLEEAIKRKPDEGALYGLLAKLVKDPAEKARLLENAISARNPCVATLRKRAERARTGGNLHESRALLEDALERVPGDPSLQREYASVSLEIPSSWPKLETKLLRWLEDSRSDEAIELLADLYIRTERWEALKSSALHAGESPPTRALVELARAVAGQDRAALAKLDRVPWSLAKQPRWIKPVIAALTLATRFNAADRAKGWFAALPESWDELRQNLLELIDP